MEKNDMVPSLRSSVFPERSVYVRVEEPEGHPVNSFIEPVQSNSHNSNWILRFNTMAFSHISVCKMCC